MKKAFLLSSLLLLLGRAALAQGVASDSSALAAATAATRLHYTQATQAEARLLSGTEYINYSRPNSLGNQFFQSAIAQPGTITYDGQLFAGVPLLYDLNLDQVVLPDPGRNVSIQLLPEKVQSFSIGDHRFVRLVSADTTSKAAMPTGFYDVLLAPNAQGVALLARRTKRNEQQTVAGSLVFEYKEKSQLFVQKSSSFLLVDNLKGLLSFLNPSPEQKAELQKFVRTYHLKFSSDHREASALAVVRYYRSLTQ